MNLPSVTPPGVLSAQLDNPREYDPRNARDYGANLSLWQTVQFFFPGSIVAFPDNPSVVSPWIEAAGTSFQLTELVGANVIGVKFDTVGTFLKMQDGDTFEGSFTRIQFKALQTVGVTTGLLDAAGIPDIRVTGFASNGGRLVKAPKREGMSDGFLTWTGSANATGGTNVLDSFRIDYTGGGGFRRNMPTPGANGGQIVVKNTGLQTLYLYTQNPRDSNAGVWWAALGAGQNAPNPATAWPLEPGESITIPLKSRLTGLYAATKTGTTTFACMADSCGDMSLTGDRTLD